VFLPLGGVGEIGMNLGLYGFGPEGNRKWLIVDCGVSFAGPELPGIDLVMPDIKFLEDEVNNIAGMVITHAHEDHYGAILHLWPFLKVPVYATAFTAGLLAAKTESEPGAEEVPVTVVRQGERHTIGPFDVEFVAMAHSIPEPCALAIRTPAGLVLHTGDWKIDTSPGIGQPIDLDRLAELGREGVMALVCDSTNAVRDGVSPSEADVAAELTKVIGRAKHRVAVTTFASNVARIRAIARAAAANERDVVVVGRSMHRAIEVANELEYMDDLPAFHDEEAYGYLPRDKVVLLCTGSQGENRAALWHGSPPAITAMSRLSQGRHGDLFLADHSRQRKGGCRGVSIIWRTWASTSLPTRMRLVHVSGHPRRGELVQLYKLLKPKVLLPVHGEPLHLAAQAEFAKRTGRSRSRARQERRHRSPDWPARPQSSIRRPSGFHGQGRPTFSTTRKSPVSSERRKLSFAGAADHCSGHQSGRRASHRSRSHVLLGLPDTDDEGEPMENIVIKAVNGAMKSIPKARRKDKELIARSRTRAGRASRRSRACGAKRRSAR
jgi:ribonuclease J